MSKELKQVIKEAGQGEAAQEGAEPNVQQFDFEGEARKDGWDPDRYAKEDPRWVDAETFVKRGSEISPFLKKQNDRLKGEISEQSAKISTLTSSLKEFGKMYKQVQENAYARAIDEAKKEKRVASKEGNEELVDQLADHIEELKEKSKAIPDPTDKLEEAKPSATPSPILQQWHSQNTWYGTDKSMTRMANSISAELAHTHPHLNGTRAFLDLLDTEMKESMPEKFSNSVREKGSPVGGGSTTRSQQVSAKKSYKDLPSEARTNCDTMFAYSGLGANLKEKFRTDFALNYFSS